jgi:glycosyltransferase involved in cell wall biosynthesis
MNARRIAPISIIIPTLNEARYLPKLLKSIRNQTIQPLEIIVADAGSTDTTRQLAIDAGCIVIEGGLPGPGRNAGARIARGDYLHFLDADVILPKQFIELALHEFELKYLDISTVITDPITPKHIDKLFFQLQTSLMLQLQENNPFTWGGSILVTKRMHRRIRGFNEKMRVGEDNDYGNRARKLAHYGVITSTNVQMDLRRFDKIGRLKLIQTYMHQGLLNQLRPLGINLEVEYEFGNYSKITSLSSAEQFLENVLVFVEQLKSKTTNEKHRDD